MQIRSINRDDVETVVTFMEELLRDDPEEMPCNREELVRKMDDAIMRPDEVEVFVLSEVDGRLSGYFVLAFCYSFEFGGRYLSIDEMYVVPEFRGRGYAKSMLDFADDYAKEHDCKSVYMVTTNSNERARNLYRKYGFSDMVRYDHYKFIY
jgi:ribosomal protein S18 acetylase RimI-like enzyme